jgi:hypothetical protein
VEIVSMEKIHMTGWIRLNGSAWHDFEGVGEGLMHEAESGCDHIEIAAALRAEFH